MEKLVTMGMTAREVFAVAVAPTGSGLLQGALMGHWGAFIFGMTASYVFAAAVGLPDLGRLFIGCFHTPSNTTTVAVMVTK